jgi:hypothetical protein
MTDLDQVIRRAERAGLVLEHVGKHPRIVDPRTRRFVTISGTPKCPFAHKHVLRDLRRYLGVTLS